MLEGIIKALDGKEEEATLADLIQNIFNFPGEYLVEPKTGNGCGSITAVPRESSDGDPQR